MIQDVRPALAPMLHRVHGYLAGHQRVTLSGALVFSLLVGLLDFLTGTELSFYLFYLGPVALAAWYVGGRAGYGLAWFSAMLWLVADMSGGRIYSQLWIHLWNTMIRLAVFLMVAGLLVRLKDALTKKETLANTDALTHLSNRRAFNERLELELQRAARYRETFTLVFFDLDNFKLINDSLGHDTGDELLTYVGTVLRGHTRAVDTVARLGGDEFAVLFTLMGPQAAGEALTKLREALLAAMQARGWPVTFSIGAITFLSPAGTAQDLLRAVDELQYRVKRRGKNGLCHEVRIQHGAEATFAEH